MQKMIKKAGQDFVILNLTDIHMDNEKLDAGNSVLEILHRTLDGLMAQVKPDLITVTGDMAWGGHRQAMEYVVKSLDALGIPWAPVFGNHDQEKGMEELEAFEDILTASPLCLYEAGDRAYGAGNYIILVEDEETGKPVEGIFMLDSHQNTKYVNEKGEVSYPYAKLWDNQLQWYAEEVEKCKKMGCPETAIFQHIPPYGFRQAWNAAFRADLNPKEMPAPLGKKDCWNPGYENTTGVHYEEVGCYPYEDGVLDAVIATDSTRYMFCGHEHINNWQIDYRGIHLVYTCKTGSGAYWHPAMNGGTIIRIGENGICSVEHAYVEIPAELCARSRENVAR